jgi:uncharacterized protein (DUF885 family)
MSAIKSAGFRHGQALRSFATKLAEGAQYFALGTSYLSVEATKQARRYVADLVQGIQAAEHLNADRVMPVQYEVAPPAPGREYRREFGLTLEVPIVKHSSARS